MAGPVCSWREPHVFWSSAPIRRCKVNSNYKCPTTHRVGFILGRRQHGLATLDKVREGTAHAALVFDGETCVGWCQFGTAEELTRIKHFRAYQENVTAIPNWRITCFFVDKAYRGKGVSAIALVGALEEISRLGGGTVESYPEDATGREILGSFLYNSNISIFEHHGFQKAHRIGKNRGVMSKVIQPAAFSASSRAYVTG